MWHQKAIDEGAYSARKRRRNLAKRFTLIHHPQTAVPTSPKSPESCSVASGSRQPSRVLPVAVRRAAADLVVPKSCEPNKEASFLGGRTARSGRVAASIRPVIQLTNRGQNGHDSEQMISTQLSSVLERQLLLQLGHRLRHLRKSQGLGTVEMASRVDISRNTLRAIENGDPAPSIGSYLRVMSVLGVSGEFAMLAGDSITRTTQQRTAPARSRRINPVVQVVITADASRHTVEDLQSVALHQAAVDLVKVNPALLVQTEQTLARWMAKGPSRSNSLWLQWEAILHNRQWRKVLAYSRRAQELRQSSPLVTILPQETRKLVLDQIAALKKGVVMGKAT